MRLYSLTYREIKSFGYLQKLFFPFPLFSLLSSSSSFVVIFHIPIKYNIFQTDSFDQLIGR